MALPLTLQNLTIVFCCIQKTFPLFHPFARCCTGSVGERPLPLLCPQRSPCHPQTLRAEHRSAPHWHECWAEGKADEEGKLGSTVELLRCSTG